MKNFMSLQKEYSDYDKCGIVILPIPYEATVSYGKGCSKAPEAIIRASNELEPYDEEIKKEACFEKGICTLEPINSEKIHDLVYEKAKKIVNDNKFLVSIGGEHSISIGIVKALKEKYKLSVLQFDAHADLKYSFEGSQFNHACIARRIFPLCRSLVQFGVRSLDIDEHNFILENKDKIKTFFAKDIYDNEKWMQEAIDALDENVYITIDVDGFDPSIIPHTGTPEPGGLDWYTVINFFKKVFKEKNVVGFDVVELSPNKYSRASDFTIAKLIYKMIGYRFLG